MEIINTGQQLMPSALLSHSTNPEWERDTQTEMPHGQGRLQKACKGLQRSSCSPPRSLNYTNGVLQPRADCNSEFGHWLPLPGGRHFHIISCSSETGGDLTVGSPKAREKLNCNVTNPEAEVTWSFAGRAKMDSGLSCVPTALQNQQPTHLPA